jgi:hypothetical protein
MFVSGNGTNSGFAVVKFGKFLLFNLKIKNGNKRGEKTRNEWLLFY